MILLAVSQAVGSAGGDFAHGWGVAIGALAVASYLWARTRTFVALNGTGHLQAFGFVLGSFLLTLALVVALTLALVL